MSDTPRTDATHPGIDTRELCKKLERELAEANRRLSDGVEEIRTLKNIIDRNALLTIERAKESASYAEALKSCVEAAKRIAPYLTKTPNYVEDGEAWNARAYFLQQLWMVENVHSQGNVGLCNVSAPSPIKGDGPMHCTLPAGHAGMHRNGVGGSFERHDQGPLPNLPTAVIDCDGTAITPAELARALRMRDVIHTPNVLDAAAAYLESLDPNNASEVKP